LGIKAFGRTVVGPPGIPADRLADLQKIWKDILTDPVVIAEGEKTQRNIDYLDAEATRKGALRVISDLTPAQKKRVVDILLKDSK
jgi:hypothetical protein